MQKLVFMLCGVLAFSLVAETVDVSAVGWREKVDVSVGAGETKSLAAPLAIGAKGAVTKTGAGTLEVPVAALERAGREPAVEVLQGTLKLVGTALPAQTLQVPDCVVSRATCWFSAADPDYVVRDGEGHVTKWYDARETGVTEAGFSPTRAYMQHACIAGQTDAPQTWRTFKDHNAVYFGGYDARNLGGYMQLTRNGAAENHDYVYNVFYVHGVSNCLGAVIGHTKQPGDFMNGGSPFSINESGHEGYFYNRADGVPGMFTARFFRNGVFCDPFLERVSRNTFEMIDVDFAENGTGFDSFFNNRNVQGRQGGDFISEAIVFTNRLSEAERVDVERYLMRKWGFSGMATTALGVAANASVELPTTAASVTTAASTNHVPLVFDGEGAVSVVGTGTFVVGPGMFADFNGAFSPGQASLFSRFGEFPVIEPTAGRVYTTAVNRPGNMSDVRNGVTLSQAAGAANTIATTGDVAVAFSSVPAEVKRLSVRGGTLSLVGRDASAVYRPADGVQAIFPNPDMEKVQYTDPNGNRGRIAISSGATKDGWSFDAAGGFTGGYVVGPLMRPGYEWGYDIVQGRQALFIFSPNGGEGHATLYTTANFPAAGEYLVSWRTAFSYYGRTNPLTYSIIFGATFATAEKIESHVLDGVAFTRVYTRISVPSAGDYCFGFCVDANYNSYYAMMFDDVRADLVTKNARSHVVPIPNGDFEQVTTAAAGGALSVDKSDGNLRTTTYPVGWTLFQGTDWTANLVAIVAPASPALPTHTPQYKYETNNSAYKRYSRSADDGLGSFQLFLCNHPSYPGTYAETTFTVAEPGIYRLRGKVARWNVSHMDIDHFGANGEFPTVQARATVGDVVTDLGTIASKTIILADSAWPNVFAVPAANTAVTIRLTQTTSRAACILDDFVLVKDDAPAVDEGEELIDNGSFEKSPMPASGGGVASADGWSTGAGSLDSQATSFWSTFGNGTQYTICPYDGVVVCNIRGTSSLFRPLPRLRAGRYRFRVATNTRWTGGYDENGIRVTLNDPITGEAKYVICEIPEVKSYYAQVSCHEVDVDVPGDYVFTITGTQAAPRTGDRCCVVDALSLKRVYGGKTVPPSLPSKLKIEVAEGAKLNLDFVGTLPSGIVRLGARTYTGTIDAAGFPDFVTGTGALEAKSEGTLVIVR